METTAQPSRLGLLLLAWPDMLMLYAFLLCTLPRVPTSIQEVCVVVGFIPYFPRFLAMSRLKIGSGCDSAYEEGLHYGLMREVSWAG